MRHHTEHIYTGPPPGFVEVNAALHLLSTTSTVPAPRQRKLRPKRHKKPKRDHTPRPPNVWILYRSDKLVDMRAEDGDDRRPQANLSKLIAELWKREPPDIKRKYEQLADLRKVQHQQQYPDYRFQPKKKEPKVPRRTGSASAGLGSSPHKESAAIRYIRRAESGVENPLLGPTIEALAMSRAASEAAGSFSPLPPPDFASPLPSAAFHPGTVGEPILTYSNQPDIRARVVERPAPIRPCRAPADASSVSFVDPPQPPPPFLYNPPPKTFPPPSASSTVIDGFATSAADEYELDFGSPDELPAPDTPSRLAASWAEIRTPEETPAKSLADPQKVLAGPILFEPPPAEWLQSGPASAPASLAVNAAPFFEPSVGSSSSGSGGVPSPSHGSASPAPTDPARLSTSGTWTAHYLSAHPAFMSLTLPASELETAAFDNPEASSPVYSPSTSPYTPFTQYTPFMPYPRYTSDAFAPNSLDSPVFDELARWTRDDAAAQSAPAGRAAAVSASVEEVLSGFTLTDEPAHLAERSPVPGASGLGLYLERAFPQVPPLPTATQHVAHTDDDFGMAAYRQRTSQDITHS